MKPGQVSLLRLYTNARNRLHGKPLYEAVVLKARELGLAGASVYQAEVGYGVHRHVHDSMSEYTFIDSPVIVEVIEAPERINALLSALGVVSEALATVSIVSLVHAPWQDQTPALEETQPC